MWPSVSAWGRCPTRHQVVGFGGRFSKQGKGGSRGDSWCLGGEESHLTDILAIAPVMLVSGRIAIVNRGPIKVEQRLGKAAECVCVCVRRLCVLTRKRTVQAPSDYISTFDVLYMVDRSPTTHVCPHPAEERLGEVDSFETTVLVLEPGIHTEFGSGSDGPTRQDIPVHTSRPFVSLLSLSSVPYLSPRAIPRITRALDVGLNATWTTA